MFFSSVFSNFSKAENNVNRQTKSRNGPKQREDQTRWTSLVQNKEKHLAKMILSAHLKLLQRRIQKNLQVINSFTMSPKKEPEISRVCLCSI